MRTKPSKPSPTSDTKPTATPSVEPSATPTASAEPSDTPEPTSPSEPVVTPTPKDTTVPKTTNTPKPDDTTVPKTTNTPEPEESYVPKTPGDSTETNTKGDSSKTLLVPSTNGSGNNTPKSPGSHTHNVIQTSVSAMKRCLDITTAAFAALIVLLAVKHKRTK